MTDDVKALIVESRVRGRKGWVEANPDLAAGLIRNLGAALKAATVAPAVDREALVDVLQGPDADDVHDDARETYLRIRAMCRKWNAETADAILASGILRDVRDVQAEALEQAAKLADAYKSHPRAYIGSILRERAQAIREARND